MANILLIQTFGNYQNHLTTMLSELDIEYVQAGCCCDLGSSISSFNSSLVCYLFDESADNGVLTDLQIPRHIPLLVIHSNDSATAVPVTKEVCELVDFIQAPFSSILLQHKISFLQSISRRLTTLTDLQEETERLRSRINELTRSVDGHNSFLDLMSRRDGLTGMFNRRHFNSVIQNTFQATKEGKNEISLCILNIDYFSEINKSCGQNFGDFVLNELSARITSSIRESDISFRLSGEEFAILMMDAALTDAMNRAEDIRTLCESKNFNNGHHSRNVTISVGVASVTTHAPSSHDEFFNMADQALFLAKSEGRNRVMQHVPIDRGSHGTTEQNFKILKDTISKILDKTKVSTVRSLQLLAQGIIEEEENEQGEEISQREIDLKRKFLINEK